MIKCFGFGKLLKQLFIILLISCFGLLVNSFVKSDYVNFGSPFEYYGDNFCNINSNYGIACSKSSILLTNYDAGYYKSVSSLFRTDEGIGFYYKSNPNNLNPFSIQGVINTGFVLCSGDTSSIISGSSLLYADSDFCEGGYTKLVLSYSELLDFFRNHSPRLVGTYFPGYDVGIYFVFDGYYFTETLFGGVDARPLNGQYIVKDMGISGQDYDTLTYGNNVLQSPFGNGGGDIEIPDSDDLVDYNYSVVSDNDLITYFENSPLYKFNPNVCRVGTDDFSTLLSSVYNSGGVSYSSGLGSDIFQFYSSLYGNNFNITELGSFINVWRSNYGTIFMTSSSDRLFRMLYNSDGTVLLQYDNLDISRYMSLPYVYYTFGQINYTFGSQSSIGEEVATYCYYKLGYNNNSGYNIIDNHNSSYDYNAGVFVDNYKRSQGYRSGDINIISQSRDGTPLDYFTGDDNLDFNTFFNKTFNKFKDSFTINIQDLGAGFLPTYIIMFLLAIILFRFISH